MARTYKYGKGRENYIKTDALKKYRDENGLKTSELAAKTGDSMEFISRCISRGIVPRAILENLGIKARARRTETVRGGGYTFGWNYLRLLRWRRSAGCLFGILRCA